MILVLCYPPEIFMPRFVRMFAALSLASLSTLAVAQTWPTKPITLIVPYAAGGNVDAVARWIAPELGKRLGQTIIIDNVAGAGGIIGTDKAARAVADGHTLLLSVESTIVIAKLVSPSVQLMHRARVVVGHVLATTISTSSTSPNLFISFAALPVRHTVLLWTMLFRMVSSFRMQATRATFFSLPFASRCL